MKTCIKCVVISITLCLMKSIIPVSSPAAVEADSDFIITVGEDQVFTEFNYHYAEYDASSGGNSCQASVTALAEEQLLHGTACVGVQFQLASEYTVADLYCPVRITINFSYSISANCPNGDYTDAGACIRIPWESSFNNDGGCYDSVDSLGSNAQTVSLTYDTTLTKLLDASYSDDQGVIGVEASANLNRSPTCFDPYVYVPCQCSASSNVTINSIGIDFLNPPPSASFTFSPEQEEKPMVGGLIEFDASGSSGCGLQYEWDFGDGETTGPSTDHNTTHIYEIPDNYEITLTVRDPSGQWDEQKQNIDLSDLEIGDLLLCRSEWSWVPATEWSHVGMYVGEVNGQHAVVEARWSSGVDVYGDTRSGVGIYPLTDWSYSEGDPYPEQWKSWVRAIRVTEDSGIRLAAANFAMSKEGQSFDQWKIVIHAGCKDQFSGDVKVIDATSWYCSELVWAAYMSASSGTINFDKLNIDITGWAIPPDEIGINPTGTVVGEHKENRPSIAYKHIWDGIVWSFEKVVGIWSFCPVNLRVTDPDGHIITKDESHILGSNYQELDLNNDGETDDFVAVLQPKSGAYLIEVIPEPEAQPEDTYSLQVIGSGGTVIVAENVLVSDIPEDPYVVHPTGEALYVNPSFLEVTLPIDETTDTNLSIENNYSDSVEYEVTCQLLEEPIIIHDPSEGSLFDLRQISANITPDSVDLTIETYTDFTEGYGLLFLDTDQNPVTGLTDAMNPGYGLNDIGADYGINLMVFGITGEAELCTLPDGTTISTLPVVVSPHSLSFSIPLIDIADDGVMDLTLIMMDSEETIDVAPDSGHGTTVAPVNWLSAMPSAGVLPSNSQVNVTVQFDSTGVEVGDHNAVIVINSNYPDEDPVSVPVTMHVTETIIPPIPEIATISLLGTGLLVLSGWFMFYFRRRRLLKASVT